MRKQAIALARPSWHQLYRRAAAASLLVFAFA